MIAPSEAFRGSDGRFFVISPTGEKFWAEFCDVIGRPDLASDHRFTTGGDRIAHVDELAEELSRVFEKQPASHWVKLLEQGKVPAAPVLDVAEALNQDPAMLRAMVESVVDPLTHAILPMLGNPFKYASTDAPLSFPPRFGQHSRDVLRRVCGYSDQTIDELAAAGAIALGAAAANECE
jgi:crotonobetainyl-CoA:carnitine CoA-transferase CaiB-like acyl-CoA transferase